VPGVTSVEIIFEDDGMLVARKPAGWAVAGGRKTEDGQHPVLARTLAEAGHARIQPAHRVDDAVQGLVVFAKSKAALDFLSGEFQSKQARRGYRGFAILATDDELAELPTISPLRLPTGGLPVEFEVNYALAPDQHVPGRMHVYRRRGGRPALTKFRVAEPFGRYVWFEAWPETSRQMQVQAHLAAVGAPVLGDHAHGLADVELRLSELKRGYKGRATERPLIPGLALQAHHLTVRHPETREAMSWELPLPKEFAVALRNLRKFSRK